MSELWSKKVQAINTLYTSRLLRFSDAQRDKYLAAFGIADGADILEIGCGPGALSQALKRWYPVSKIIGLDYDSAFVEFAKSRSADIEFIEGDATALPFADGSFDVTISNTVQEHIAPESFFPEQLRVLKDGGRAIVLSARRGINSPADFIAEMTDFELKIWERVDEYYDKTSKELGIGRYSVTERELPLLMEKYGFREVSTEYLTVNLTPDNPSVPRESALEMINSGRLGALDSVNNIPNVAPGIVSEEELAEMCRLINERYDRRVEHYEKGEKLWDTTVSLTMVVSGIK